MVVMRVAFVHDGERQAGIDPPPVDDHRAGAALAVVAALLGAGQVQMLAQRVEQRGARVELELVRLPFTVKDTFASDGSLGIGRGSLGVGSGRYRVTRGRGGCPDQEVTPG